MKELKEKLREIVARGRSESAEYQYEQLLDLLEQSYQKGQEDLALNLREKAKDVDSGNIEEEEF